MSTQKIRSVKLRLQKFKMKKSILILFFFLSSTALIFAQDVFFKTGRNFTTYDYRNSDGLKASGFIPRVGSTFEIGLGYPFSVSKQENTFKIDNIQNKRNWFRNEVSFMVNSYNAYGGDLNNNYSYETTFGGIKNQFSLLAKAGNLEFGLIGSIGMNRILSGTQLINNSRFNLKGENEFRNIFLQTGLGASAAYPLFDNAFLSVAYNYTVNRRPSIQNEEYVNFNSRVVLFGIHFKLD